MKLWKHRKTGTIYEIVGYTVIEDGWKPAVVYRPYGKDGTTARPCVEFFDGRFTPVATANPQPRVEREPITAELLGLDGTKTVHVLQPEPERPEADFTPPLPRRAAYQLDDGA